MRRRPFSALLAALLTLAPFPAWSQVGRISFEAPGAPAPVPALSAAVFGAASVVPLALTGAMPAPALVPALSAPAAQVLMTAHEEAVPASGVFKIAKKVSPVQILTEAGEKAAVSPETIGRLYDSAPAAPDFTALSPVRTPEAPSPWKPASTLLKPVASVVNAWRSSRHAKRLDKLGPDARVTTEEAGMRDSLTSAHDAIGTGFLQDALETLSRLFTGRSVNAWYRSNSAYQPYQNQGHAYMRFVERAIKLAYERAHGRARDAELIAEARTAARAGTLLGREWRMTPIQERDSAHCVHHALFNAILASAGFASPVTVELFIERARARLNVSAESVTKARGSELASLQNALGFKLGVDVGEGMGPESIKKFAQILGLGFEARGPPKDDAGWSALLGPGRETLISLRMFHERFKHSPQEADLRGHDYTMIHHEVYLLGAFDSPSRGARLYMVQDSGSGATDFYTAEELSAVASELQVVKTAGPVALP